MENMTELKPCPFCGGEAAWFSYADGYTDWFDVKCRNVWCLAKSSQFDTLAEAVEAWNTRAATTIGRVQVEVEPTERTCTMLRLTDYTCQYMHRYMCSECGEYNEQPTVMGESTPPNYCPCCGRKVVER